MIDLGPLKERVRDLYPAGHAVRELVLAEPDALNPEAFAEKAQQWYRTASVLDATPR